MQPHFSLDTLCIIRYKKYMGTKTVNLRDLPEDLVRRAKACAALHGMTLKDFVVEALETATKKDLPASYATAALVGSSRHRKAK